MDGGDPGGCVFGGMPGGCIFGLAVGVPGGIGGDGGLRAVSHAGGILDRRAVGVGGVGGLPVVLSCVHKLLAGTARIRVSSAINGHVPCFIFLIF
jgi:hypothetical protein